LHALPCRVPRWHVGVIAQREMEFFGDVVEVLGGKGGPPFHQRCMYSPEIAGLLCRIFRQFGGPQRLAAGGKRAVSKDVPQPISKAAPEASDDFMYGVTLRARVAAIFKQRHFRIRIAQHVVAARIDGRVELER
jgi:hypothetical protein